MVNTQQLMSAGKKYQWLEVLSKLHYKEKQNLTLYTLSFIFLFEV